MVQPDSGEYPTWLAEVQQMLDRWKGTFQQRGVMPSLQVTRSVHLLSRIPLANLMLHLIMRLHCTQCSRHVNAQACLDSAGPHGTATSAICDWVSCWQGLNNCHALHRTAWFAGRLRDCTTLPIHHHVRGPFCIIVTGQCLTQKVLSRTHMALSRDWQYVSCTCAIFLKICMLVLVAACVAWPVPSCSLFSS